MSVVESEKRLGELVAELCPVRRQVMESGENQQAQQTRIESAVRGGHRIPIHPGKI